MNGTYAGSARASDTIIVEKGGEGEGMDIWIPLVIGASFLLMLGVIIYLAFFSRKRDEDIPNYD
jgi:hypothetical protein